MAGLKEGEIWVVDEVESNAWRVFRIKYTKKTDKCYVLKGPYRDRRFKKAKCFKNYTYACRLARQHNIEVLDKLECQIVNLKYAIAHQEVELTEQAIESRFDILDL